MTYKLDHITVLLVDDMRPMLELTRSILSTFGFENILMADNGQEAFELFCKHDPDFIIPLGFR